MKRSINLLPNLGSNPSIELNKPRFKVYSFGGRVVADGGTFEADNCMYNTINNILLDTASLIVTPNGYKEGKLYSVIPSDGSGDLSVTRATTATRVNSAGLVELVPYNLLQYSQQFDTSPWIAIGTTIIPNTQIAPDGTTTGDTYNTSQSILLLQTVSASSNTTYTISMWVKLGTATNLCLIANNTAAWNTIGGESFDSADGLNTSTWTRISWTFTTPISLPAGAINIHLGGNAETGLTQSTGSVYIWGAQLVEGSTAKDYQKTETRLNIPRLDYSNGTCPSILVEPQRTNLLAYSEQFDNAGYWSTYQSTITGNTTTAPNGTLTADTLTALANTGGDAYRLIAFSGTYTASCYIKAGTSNKARIGFSSGEVVFYDLSTGVVTTSGVVTGSMVDAGNGWWRCIATVNSTTIYTAFSNDGTNGQTVYLWGAQLEAGSYATSYIPTTSASVTRNADVISKTGISSLIGQTEGTLFVDLDLSQIETQALSVDTLMMLNDGTTNNEIAILLDVPSGNPRTLLGLITSGGTYQTLIYDSSIATETRYKIALAYKANDVVMYINGQLIGTDTSASIPTTSNLSLSKRADGSWTNDCQTLYNAVALWKTRLTNTQLAELTSL